MLRRMKMLLVASVALWGLIGAFGNVTDWSGTLSAVNAVTSMSTFEGGTASWQAISNPVVTWAGALFIVLSKVTTGILCSIGALRMWRLRESDVLAFVAAKEAALAGCAIAVVMLFGGFIVIAESWFELWRSEAMRGPALETAFRYAGMISLIAIFVASKDE